MHLHFRQQERKAQMDQILYLARSPQQVAVAAHFTMAPFPAVKMDDLAALAVAVQEPAQRVQAIRHQLVPHKVQMAAGQ